MTISVAEGNLGLKFRKKCLINFRCFFSRFKRKWPITKRSSWRCTSPSHNTMDCAVWCNLMTEVVCFGLGFGFKPRHQAAAGGSGSQEPNTSGVQRGGAIKARVCFCFEWNVVSDGFNYESNRNTFTILGGMKRNESFQADSLNHNHIMIYS